MTDKHDTIEAIPFQRAEVATQRPWIKLNPAKIAFAAVFLILAVAAAFMFTARAISIVVTPMPENLTITSGFHYELADRYLMLPGTYSFTASKNGYHNLDQEFSVTSDPDQTYQFELMELPGILTIATEPNTSAEVYIDQKLVGTTPLR
ncbi:MAG: hypothetical protein ACI809_001521, partial [Candidatus Azotimanducaceae bacterium]